MERAEHQMQEKSHHEMMAEDFKRRFLITLPLTIVILVLSSQIQQWLRISFDFPGRELVLFILGTIVVAYGGLPFFRASKDELKSKNWGMMTLVSLAVISGYLFSLAATFLFQAMSLWWEISTLVSVFLFGHWMEMKAVIGTGGALKELSKLIPDVSHKVVGAKTKDVSTKDLVKGDVVLIKPGEKIPVDGVVVEGSSSVNESMITGESRPIEKQIGSEVIGGTINSDGALTIKVTKTGANSALSQITELIKKAQETKPNVQKLADKAANYLTIIAIAVGSFTFIYWIFINPIGIAAASTFAIAVIVITCPHALGLAIPTVTTITTTLAARNGILVRDMRGLEVAKKLDYIVLDKTGTLTKGEFGISKIIKIADIEADEILKLAASIESKSEHFIAKGIVEEAKKRKIKAVKVTDFKSIAGKGAVGNINDKKIIVGNLEMLKKEEVIIEEKKDSETGTIVYVASEEKLLGKIILSDDIRKESEQAVESFHKLGIKVAMLTGDKKEIAEAIGKKLAIDTVFSEVLPEEKAKKVKELQGKGFVVGMVGDGVNDAPSLAQANLGIAIGAGTQVAIESADIVLVKSNPLDIVKAISLSKKTDSKMKQNLAWATGYNVVAIPAAAGLFSSYGLILRPEWAALLMSASSVIVVANALLLKKAKL